VKEEMKQMTIDKFKAGHLNLAYMENFGSECFLRSGTR